MSRGEYRGGGKKSEWRQNQIDFILQSKLFVKGKITHSVVALLGDLYNEDGTASGLQQYELLKPYLEDPMLQYHACERDAFQVFKNRSLWGGPLPFNAPHADIYVVAMEEAQRGTPTAAIFDFDLTQQVGNQDFWYKYGQDFTRLVDTALKSAPEVVFLLNNTLDRSSREHPPETRLRQHAEEIAKRFSAFGVTPERLLGRRDGRVFLPKADLVRNRLDDEDQGRRPQNVLYTGRVGAFEVYRSEGRPSRMATVRFRLTQNRTAIIEGDEALGW